MVPTSDPCVFPSTIPSTVISNIPVTGYPNLLLSPVPYAIPNHSPSGPYLLPSFIKETLFFPPTYHQCHLQNNSMKKQVLKNSHPQD